MSGLLAENSCAVCLIPPQSKWQGHFDCGGVLGILFKPKTQLLIEVEHGTILAQHFPVERADTPASSVFDDALHQAFPDTTPAKRAFDDDCVLGAFLVWIHRHPHHRMDGRDARDAWLVSASAISRS